ncbi:MAG: hypothetical protein J6A75_03310 [Lachnospiraceae bacterium]|nr:hypothetical protein [Lachnospiraceae bacterium]
MDLLILIITIAVAVLKSKQKNAKKKPATVAQINKNAQKRQQQQMQNRSKPQNLGGVQQQAADINRQRELKQRLEQKYRNKPDLAGTILDRAVGNVAEEAKDELKITDAKHHMAAGGSMQKKNMDTPQVNERVLIDKVYDLMVTGYSGNMQFERDFLAEGMDMLNRIQG